MNDYKATGKHTHALRNCRPRRQPSGARPRLRRAAPAGPALHSSPRTRPHRGGPHTRPQHRGGAAGLGRRQSGPRPGSTPPAPPPVGSRVNSPGLGVGLAAGREGGPAPFPGACEGRRRCGEGNGGCCAARPALPARYLRGARLRRLPRRRSGDASAPETDTAHQRAGAGATRRAHLRPRRPPPPQRRRRPAPTPAADRGGSGRGAARPWPRLCSPLRALTLSRRNRSRVSRRGGGCASAP